MKVTHTQNIVVQATDYGVWGDVLREQKTDELLYKYRFGYQGQFAEKDEETGWNHFEAREYDPIIARWTSTDPMGQFWSPFIGMGNDPISSVDPDGRFSKFGAWWRSQLIPNSGTFYDSNADEWGITWQNKIEIDGNVYHSASVIFEGGPGWRKGLGTDILNSVQTAFDYGGAVPVAGEAIDGLNAAIYALRGDWKNAGLSTAAMIPILGTGSTLTKVAAKNSDELVALSKQLHGGNVTVTRNGQDLFRVHQSGTHGSAKATVTNFQNNSKGILNPNTGKSYKNAVHGSMTRSHVNKLYKALTGQGGYSIRTRGR